MKKDVRNIDLSLIEESNATKTRRLFGLLTVTVFISYVLAILVGAAIKDNVSYIYASNAYGLIDVFSGLMPELRAFIELSLGNNMPFQAAYVLAALGSSLTLGFIGAVLSVIIIKSLTLDYYIYLSKIRNKSLFNGIASDLFIAGVILFFVTSLFYIIYSADHKYYFGGESYKAFGLYILFPVIFQFGIISILMISMQLKKVLLQTTDPRFN